MHQLNEHETDLNMNFVGDSAKLKNDAIGNQIYDMLSRLVTDKDACLYYNHPFYRGDIESDLISAKLFLVSRDFGLILFNYLPMGEMQSNLAEYVDTLYAEISGRMLKRTELRSNRRLKYDITPIIIVSDSEAKEDESGNIISDIDGLPETIRDLKRDLPIPKDLFDLILSCIDGTVSLNIKRERISDEKKIKVRILNEIQNHIASFDIEQRQIADVDFDGPQRIRGLAGSGKTIVLAYKAAAFHARYPDKEILYTYYTKSLGETVKSLIRRAFKNYSNGGEPNWEKVTVCHGWGSEWTPGVYWIACKDNGITPLTLSEATGHREEPFSYACKELLKRPLTPKYDLILIDEGQDFRAPFYQLCYRLSTNRKISWAYDDFQNIFDVKIQDEVKTFGYDDAGKPNVEFESGNALQDVTLKKCYRNPRYTLIYAFALGLGIYNDRVLQRLASNDQWESLGFHVEQGDSVTGDQMVISRPMENTPSYSNEAFDDKCVEICTANSMMEECRTVAEKIAKCIRTDGLRPEDICVICIDHKSISGYLSTIERLLRKDGIDTFNHLTAPYTSTRFFVKDAVTLTSVNRAKGNECGAVFICGTDVVFNDKDNVVLRDKLFTAMTRTKGWLYISGTGDSMAYLKEEISQLKKNRFKLIFRQPDESDTKTIEDVSRATLRAEDAIASQINALKSLGLDETQIKTILENLVKKA